MLSKILVFGDNFALIAGFLDFQLCHNDGVHQTGLTISVPVLFSLEVRFVVDGQSESVWDVDGPDWVLEAHEFVQVIAGFELLSFE